MLHALGHGLDRLLAAAAPPGGADEQRLDGAQQFLRDDLVLEFARRETGFRILQIRLHGAGLRVERGNMRGAQLLAQRHGLAAVAGMDDDVRPERPLSFLPPRRAVGDADGQHAPPLAFADQRVHHVGLLECQMERMRDDQHAALLRIFRPAGCSPFQKRRNVRKTLGVVRMEHRRRQLVQRRLDGARAPAVADGRIGQQAPQVFLRGAVVAVDLRIVDDDSVLHQFRQQRPRQRRTGQGREPVVLRLGRRQPLDVAILVLRAQVLEEHDVHAVEAEPVVPDVLVREIGQPQIQRGGVFLQGVKHAPVQAHEAEPEAGRPRIGRRRRAARQRRDGGQHDQEAGTAAHPRSATPRLA